VSNFLTGMQLALGGACVWIIIQFARRAARQATRRVNELAHPEPACLIRHEHKGRQLADFLRKHCPDTADADLAAMCAALAAAARTAAGRHGEHALDVLLCDLGGAVRELTSIERTDVPR
jgi:hypothetical protein